MIMKLMAPAFSNGSRIIGVSRCHVHVDTAGCNTAGPLSVWLVRYSERIMCGAEGRRVVLKSCSFTETITVMFWQKCCHVGEICNVCCKELKGCVRYDCVFVVFGVIPHPVNGVHAFSDLYISMMFLTAVLTS